MSGTEDVSPAEVGQKRSRDDLAGLSNEEKRQRRCVRMSGARVLSRPWLSPSSLRALDDKFFPQ